MPRKLEANLAKIRKVIVAEARSRPVSFSQVCIACDMSPSSLYTYIPLLKETDPYIKFKDNKFYLNEYEELQHWEELENINKNIEID